jgi:hypothetical protein
MLTHQHQEGRHAALVVWAILAATPVTAQNVQEGARRRPGKNGQRYREDSRHHQERHGGAHQGHRDGPGGYETSWRS